MSIEVNIIKKFNCLGISKHVVLVAGAAEGRTKLNSFDNALIKAGINDYNLIKVSSILAKGTKIEKIKIINQVEKSSFVPCVLAKVYGKKGEKISAGIGVSLSKQGIGFVAEESGKNISKKKLLMSLNRKLKEMANKRGTKLTKNTCVLISYTCKVPSRAIAGLVYIF